MNRTGWASVLALVTIAWATGCSAPDASSGPTTGGAGAAVGGAGVGGDVPGTGGMACPGNQVECGTVCADLDSDPFFCGACDNPCPVGQVCSFGECGTTCDIGLTPCGLACVSLDTSADHCGACGAPCLATQECSSGSCVDRPPPATGGAGTGGLGPSGGTGGIGTGGIVTGGAGTGGTGAGGDATGATGSGGDSTGGIGTGGDAAGGNGTGGTDGVDPLEVTLTPVIGNTTVGLEWPSVTGATSYNLYWSTSPGITTGTATQIENVARGYVHEGLTNGTTYYYAVTAVTAAGESPASPEVSATPTGIWVLEQLGTGDFDDVLTGGRVATVPVDQRVQVLLFAEGYTASLLGDFARDVDDWIDLVFGIEPYSLFAEAFVVWSLPAASTTDIRASSPSTAFQVPVDVASSATFAYAGSIPTSGETAALAWSAIEQHPFAPTDFSGPASSRARNAIAAFLIYDPAQGAASVSGLATSLVNPSDNGQRINAAFGIGHAHEFTHSFSLVRDEYLENDNTAPNNWDGTSNVAGTNICSELPWAHLLHGSAINPDVDELVGAFGTEAIGYHSELLCLINGTHDNGEYYSTGSGSCSPTNCNLRSEDRLCNFCRETTALRVFQRTGVLAADSSGFDEWVVAYRQPFYERFGFQVPDQIPQSNDSRNPAQGAQIFEACVP